MRKLLLTFALCAMLAFPASASEDPYVYEEHAGTQVAFPKEWSINQSEDGTVTWYYPNYVFVGNDIVGYIMIQKPNVEVTEDNKELFLFYYKNGFLESNNTTFSSISRFDLSGVECERAGLIQTMDGKEYSGEMVTIVNGGSAVSMLYVEQSGASTNLKNDFDTILASISFTSGNSDKNDAASATETPMEKPSVPAAEHYEFDLSAGYYTAGVDFPAGTYRITSVAGSGNVICKGGKLNEIIGGEYGIPEYNNFSATRGSVLSVGDDAIIHLSSDNALVSEIMPRQILENYNWYELPAGIYTVGVDIPEGPYCITAVQGSGNAHVRDNTNHANGSLNEIFSASPSYSGYISRFNNLYLYEGNEIEISGDLRLRFDQIGTAQ